MANYTNHKNNKPLSKEILAEIDRRIKIGEAKTHIAKELGISHSAVRKYTKPLPFKIEDTVKQEALRRLNLGQSRSSVARELGVSRTWVSKISPEPGKKSQPISSHIKDELVERVLTGESVTGAARALGIHQDTAANILKTHTQMPGDQIIEEIRDQLASGKDIKSAAIQFKLPIQVVERIAGYKPAKRSYTDAQKEEMAVRFSNGVKQKQICLYFGCSGATVKKAYKKALKSGTVEPKITLAMEDDRELRGIQRKYPDYEEWRRYAVEWYTVVKGNFAICCATINRFFPYLEDNSLFERPVDFFLRKNAKLIPSFFESSCPASDHGAAMNNCLVDFLDWVLIQPEFADTSDESDPITLPMFKTPINRVNRSDHKPQRGAESNKKVMPYWMIYDLRRRVAQGKDFRDWIWLQTIAGKMTLSGDKESRDWFEVSDDKIDLNDPDCVFRYRERLEGPPILEMWSPVRWVVCLLKLQTTARTGQIRMLDSGEADTFVFENGSFVFNESRLRSGTVRKPRKQGAIRASGEGSICLYFNTNKTNDINKSGAEKGMECAWPKFPDHQDNPYYWIEKLRNWQAKYNPVEGAIPWKNIPSSRRLRSKSDTTCSTYPDTVFLFRTAETINSKQYPVSSGLIDTAWQSMVLDYESILLQEGKRNPDNTPIQLVRNGRAEFSPHSLRVSLITHLILDGNMPPEIMMKIVGHARFVMTIYYTKPGLQRIEDALENAAKILDATKDETLIRDLVSHSSEKIRREVVFNAKELIDVIPINPSDRNPVGWLPMHDGICLAGGNTGPVNGDSRFPGCHNGGPIIDEVHKFYGPSPGGVRNCCRCRWKCAGKHHILGLQATLNNRQYHLHKASSSAIEAERKRNELLQQKAYIEFSNRPFESMSELRVAERRYEMAMQRMEELALDLSAVYRMIERIKELPDPRLDLSALASQADAASLQTILEETDSQLLVLAGICEDVEFFPDLDPGTAIFEYAALLDQAFEREGKPLILARMSEKEKLIASNAIMRELERCANPDNSILARRTVVEIMDRGESLEKTLGIKFKRVLQVVDQSIHTGVSIRLSQNTREGVV